MVMIKTEDLTVQNDKGIYREIWIRPDYYAMEAYSTAKGIRKIELIIEKEKLHINIGCRDADLCFEIQQFLQVDAYQHIDFLFRYSVAIEKIDPFYILSIIDFLEKLEPLGTAFVMGRKRHENTGKKTCDLIKLSLAPILNLTEADIMAQHSQHQTSLDALYAEIHLLSDQNEALRLKNSVLQHQNAEQAIMIKRQAEINAQQNPLLSRLLTLPFLPAFAVNQSNAAQPLSLSTGNTKREKVNKITKYKSAQ